MAILVETANGQELTLGDQIGQKGGSGVVYRVVDRDALVGKVVVPRRRRDRTEEESRELAERYRRRVAALVGQFPDHRNEGVLVRGAAPRSAWPTTAFTVKGRPDVHGFLMPNMTTWYQPLNNLVIPSIRQAQMPDLTWKTQLKACLSLAKLVGDLHARGYVVGDMKRMNLWVSPVGDVAISDADSFQFTNAMGEQFPCEVATQGYMAPEVMSSVGSWMEPSADAWVLAVLVHELLMQGMHPFLGQPRDGTEYLSIDDNIRARRSRIVTPASVEAPRGAPDLSVLPHRLIALLQRTFDRGYDRPEERPSIDQWIEQLTHVLGQVRQCPESPKHEYHPSAGSCPWCAAVRQHEHDWYGAP